METLLHVGLEHPNTLWIGVSAVVAFVVGVGAGAYRSGLGSALRDAVDE
jgi:hypothetical protein